MTVRLAINGLGRIGRLVIRLAFHNPDIEIVAVNDLVPAASLAYLLQYDTIHGRFGTKVSASDEYINIDAQKIRVFNEKSPENLPWKDLDIDYVIESTGLFVTPEKASLHLNAGAKKVILSAPGKGDIPTFVMGVNHTDYQASSDQIVSNASCTTNCLAPVAKVLLDEFGIEEGLMTTIHAMTASQPTVDGPSKKDWRGGRAASQNIIPSSTGAAKAVTLCLPELQGKLTGMAFRIPIADVSVVDLTVRLTKSTSYEQICKAMEHASKTHLKGFLEYCTDEVVSSDFIGSTASSIFDVGAGIALNENFFKLIAWYDNETGYAARLIDLLLYMATQEKKV